LSLTILFADESNTKVVTEIPLLFLIVFLEAPFNSKIPYLNEVP